MKSITETKTTILEALSSFKSNQQYEGNQTIDLSEATAIFTTNTIKTKKSKFTTLIIMNAYKVQIRVSIMTKTQSQFAINGTL